MTSTSPLKLLAWMFALSVIALPIMGLLNGWFASERWPVKYVQVEAKFAHLSADQIHATATAHLAGGFFAIKLDEIQRAVANLPWVESVAVRKQWPDRIILQIQEHQPVARWSEKQLVSNTGVLFSVPDAESLQELPQLSGPEKDVSEVLAFYEEAKHYFSELNLLVAKIVLSDRGSWQLTLNNGAEVMIGRESAASRLQRFVAVLPRIALGRNGFDYVDLRYSNGFSIKWVAEPILTPPANRQVVDKVAITKAKA